MKKQHTFPNLGRKTDETRMSNSNCFNSRHPRHLFNGKFNICGFQKEIHVMKPGFLSDYQVLFLLLNGPQIEKSLSFNRSIYDVRGWRHLDFAIYLYNGAICCAKQTNKLFFIWVLLVKRGHILAFYRSNFRLQP